MRPSIRHHAKVRRSPFNSPVDVIWLFNTQENPTAPGFAEIQRRLVLANISLSSPIVHMLL